MQKSGGKVVRKNKLWANLGEKKFCATRIPRSCAYRGTGRLASPEATHPPWLETFLMSTACLDDPRKILVRRPFGETSDNSYIGKVVVNPSIE